MKHTDTLNSGQITVLEFVAKYRFVTVAQIQRYFNLSSRTSVNKKLGILVASGHLAMRYEQDYKFRYRPAAFYLTAKGLRKLSELDVAPYISDNLIKASYKDKTATEGFIDESGVLLDIALSLQSTYPDVKIFTARQLGGFDYFPRQLPDLYLVRGSGAVTQRFLLYRFIKDRQSFAHQNMIKQLEIYIDSGRYEESTGNDFPIILAVCDTPGLERSIQRQLQRMINQTDSAIEATTTSTKAALGTEVNIWTDLDDDELISL